MLAREAAVARRARVVARRRPVVRERLGVGRDVGVDRLEGLGHAAVQLAPPRLAHRREQALAQLVVGEADLAVLHVEDRRRGARRQPLVEIGGGIDRAEDGHVDLAPGDGRGLQQRRARGGA